MTSLQPTQLMVSVVCKDCKNMYCTCTWLKCSLIYTWALRMVYSVLLWFDSSWTAYQIPHLISKPGKLKSGCLHYNKYKDKAMTMLATKAFTSTVVYSMSRISYLTILTISCFKNKWCSTQLLFNRRVKYWLLPFFIPPVPDKHERNTGGMLFGLPIRFTHNVWHEKLLKHSIYITAKYWVFPWS